MSKPTLTPTSQTSTVILTSTGSNATTGNGAGNLVHYPLGLYTDPSSELYDTNFINGAADQVAFTYKKLGGDVLDIEITPANVYAAYEESVLEYSYHINMHQAKNMLSDVLGNSTASFDHDGQMTGGDAAGSAANLKYPRFQFTYARRVAEGMAEEAGIGGHLTEYSASFSASAGQGTYDLQNVIYSASYYNKDNGNGESVPFAGLVGDNKVRVTRVYYKTPQAMWRFFGYYGGINVIGNMMTYGQFSDDSTFEIIPAWQNKMQAMAYEDHIYTRISHFSYELINNNLTLFPTPDERITDKFWVNFTVERDAWEDDPDGIRKTGVDGINNLNTLPFDNLPYANINAIGKHWIRRYALALCKEMLGQVRGKFGGSIPIPGDNVTLNASDLLSQAATEKAALTDELKKILSETTYLQLMKNDSELLDATGKIMEEVPSPIFVG
jgi:hypothetical protein